MHSKVVSENIILLGRGWCSVLLLSTTISLFRYGNRKFVCEMENYNSIITLVQPFTIDAIQRITLRNQLIVKTSDHLTSEDNLQANHLSSMLSFRFLKMTPVEKTLDGRHLKIIEFHLFPRTTVLRKEGSTCKSKQSVLNWRSQQFF